jgi:hypothetical protein
MICGGHVAGMVERKSKVYAWFWWGNQRERDHLEDTGVDGRIILRHLQEVGWGHGLD